MASPKTGILFGCGFKNTFCFQWKWWTSEKAKKFTQTWNPEDIQGEEAKMEDVSLPSFIREGEKVKKVYHSKDSLDLALKKLTEKNQGRPLKNANNTKKNVY